MSNKIAFFAPRFDSLGYEMTAHEKTNLDPICGLFESCLKRYRTLFITWNAHVLRSTHLTESLLPRVKDEFGRLRIWGEQTYAVLPQNARRSLDEQLREDEDAKRIVTRCLQRLINHLEKAIEQTKRYSLTADVDSKDEEYSSLSDESNSTYEPSISAWEIRFRKIIESVFEGIRSLYRVSVLLRRPRTSGRYLKSGDLTILSDNALKATLDYALISEILRHWRQLTMRSRASKTEKHVAIEEESQSRKAIDEKEIADLAYLCQRFTSANLIRRKQLDHWASFPVEPEPQDAILDATNNQIHETMSDMSTSSSIAAISEQDHDSEVDKSNFTRVPDVPLTAKYDREFKCPYCRVSLNSRLMQNREIWIKHVLRDLRPYVCTFAKCEDPGRLFVTRHDWMYHEQQMHRRKWICPDGCTKDLLSKMELVQHLLTEHSIGMNDRQISVYANMCERDMKDTETDACLICSKVLPLPRLYEHLATHMEEIALLVLSNNAKEHNNSLPRQPHLRPTTPEDLIRINPFTGEPIRRRAGKIVTPYVDTIDSHDVL